MYDPHTRESRGFGFVTMESPEEADAAIAQLNGTDLMGRTLSVERVGSLDFGSECLNLISLQARRGRARAVVRREHARLRLGGEVRRGPGARAAGGGQAQAQDQRRAALGCESLCEQDVSSWRDAC